MKSFWTVLLVAAAFSACCAAERQARQSRISRHLLQVLSNPEGASEEVDVVPETKLPEPETPAVPPEPESANEVKPRNPCLDKSCGAGRICQVDDAGGPQCICIPECPQEVDPRRKVSLEGIEEGKLPKIVHCVNLKAGVFHSLCSTSTYWRLLVAKSSGATYKQGDFITVEPLSPKTGDVF